MPKAFLILSLSIFATGCYYDSEEYLFPDIGTTCDTTAVTYSGSVQPVLDQYCYRCHSNTNAPASGNNIALEDYNDVVTRAEDGSLFGSISHESLYSPMPKGGGKLDNCTITIIGIWINAGSPDN